MSTKQISTSRTREDHHREEIKKRSRTTSRTREDHHQEEIKNNIKIKRRSPSRRDKEQEKMIIINIKKRMKKFCSSRDQKQDRDRD